MKKGKIYFLLHIMLLFLSLTGVCSKLAAKAAFLSFKFFMFYGLMLFILGIYAIAWQQIIKSLPLSSAYANKAISIFWGMIWGVFIFGEHITPFKLIGAFVVIAGIFIYVSSDREQTDE